MLDQITALVSAYWRDFIAPLAVFAATMIAGWFARAIIFGRLTKWAKRTVTKADDLVVAATKGPSLLWLLILAIYLGVHASQLPENVVNIASQFSLVLIIFSVTLVLAHLITGVIRVSATKADSALPVSSLAQNVSRVVIYILGALVILGVQGINITPMLATLGVGGLAVALALQDTLSNLFAGLYISAARQIRIGDFVKLESGQEGFVTDIHWRTTTVRMLSNNVVIIPNSKLSNTVVTNYFLPQRETSVLVEMSVHYRSDLAHVERVVCQVGKQIMQEVTGGIPEHDPFIRYHTFGDSSINFSVILRGKEFVDQYLIKHEFIKRIQAGFAAEGIVIPFPIRAINYEQEQPVETPSTVPPAAS